MLAKLFKSFIPYILLLIGIFVAIFFLDSYAEKLSTQAEIVAVKADTENDDQNLSQFETDDEAGTNVNNTLKNDSIYVKAVRLYKERRYKY